MNDQVNELLNKWYDLKTTIKGLEKKMDEYKERAEALMLQRSTTELTNGVYKLEKKETMILNQKFI